MSNELNFDSIANKEENEKSDALIEPFSNIENFSECTKLKKNSLPIELKNTPLFNNYGDKIFKKSFPSAKIISLREFSLEYIIVCAFISITIYFLLITVILSKKLLLAIYCIIIYFFGIIIQVSIFPRPGRYQSRSIFEKELKNILKSYALVGSKKDKIFYRYSANYCTDITGSIDIPKSINFIKIEDITIFTDSGYKEFLKKFKIAHNNKSCSYRIHYFEKRQARFFMVNSENVYYLSGFLDAIMSILCLYWIKALYLGCSSFFNCLVIYPVKLVSNNVIIKSPTKINFQGTIIKSDDYCKLPALSQEEENNISKFENRYNSIMEKERKKKAKEEDRKNNTFVLSDFSTNNFKLKIKREYQNVYYILKVYNCKFCKKEDLGRYQPDVEEKVDEEKGIYIPNGYMIKIIITYGINKYNIRIGNFSKSFAFDED